MLAPLLLGVATIPDTSGDREFAHRVSIELNREEIHGDGELASKIFVELNREALGIPGDGPWWTWLAMMNASRRRTPTRRKSSQATRRRRGLWPTTGYRSKPPRFLVLHQAPELSDGHLDRAVLSLYRKELVVLADWDLVQPDLVIGLRVGFLNYPICKSAF